MTSAHDRRPPLPLDPVDAERNSILLALHRLCNTTSARAIKLDAMRDILDQCRTLVSALERGAKSV